MRNHKISHRKISSRYHKSQVSLFYLKFKKSIKKGRPKLLALMKNLFYPAVLGTGFIVLLNRIFIRQGINACFKDITTYFGVIIMVAFCFLYMETFLLQSVYRILTFFLDLVEIILFFLLFHFLGFFDYKATSLKIFYLLLSVSPIITQLWNVSVDDNDKILWVISLIFSSIFLMGSFWFSQYILFNIVISFLCIGLFLYSLKFWRTE